MLVKRHRALLRWRSAALIHCRTRLCGPIHGERARERVRVGGKEKEEEEEENRDG